MADHRSSSAGLALEPVASSTQALREVWESIRLHRDLPEQNAQAHLSLLSHNQAWPQ